MAIILEEKKQFNWKILITISVIVLIVGGGAWLLFFAPAPAIEIIAPSSARSTSELSNVQLDVSGVITDEKFRSLRRYTGQPSVGQVGRANPFIKF
ncbi:MAG: hypothetical protein Q7S73_00955 [bacterium]|nr:hypothetical protein [bacterium]